MAYLFNGATHVIRRADAVIQTWPLTMVCRVRLPVVDSNEHCLVALHEATLNNGFRMVLSFTGGSMKARMGTKAGGVNNNATTTTAVGDTNWHTVVGEVSAANARQVWLDNGGNASSTTSLTPGTLTKTLIGATEDSGSLSTNVGHEIADAAILAGITTADERAAFAKGISPAIIWPRLIRVHADLIRGGATIWERRGDPFTVTGATPVDHPRVYLPAHRKRLLKPSLPSLTGTLTRTLAALTAGVLGIAGNPVIVNNVNTTVTGLGGGWYEIAKTGGVGGSGDADAVSQSSLSGNIEILVESGAGDKFFVGLRPSDPTVGGQSNVGMVSLLVDRTIALAALYDRFGNQIGAAFTPSNFMKLGYDAAADKFTVYDSPDGVAWTDTGKNTTGSGGGVNFYFDSVVYSGTFNVLYRIEVVTAAVNKTLAPVTATSSASLQINATVGKTLAPVTALATGSLQLVGTVGKTLAPVTLTSSASQGGGATVNKTLAPLTASATGILTLSASVTKTLAPLTSSGSGSLALTATLSRTLAPLTAQASGSPLIAGIVNKTLAALTASGQAGLQITGTVGKTLAPVTLVAFESFVLLATPPGRSAEAKGEKYAGRSKSPPVSSRSASPVALSRSAGAA